MMPSEQFIEEVVDFVLKSGSQKVAAAALGISPQYLNDIIRCRRDPGKKVLEALGYERLVFYRKYKK